jgi:hypothetical protein
MEEEIENLKIVLKLKNGMLKMLVNEMERVERLCGDKNGF